MEQCKVTREQVFQLLGEAKAKTFWDMHLFLMDHYNLTVIWGKKIKNVVYECKYRAGEKTLCTFDLNEQKVNCLLILGREEREKFEGQRNEYSKEFLSYYDSVDVLHDGKWLYFELNDPDDVMNAKKIIGMKKKPNASISKCGYCCDRCKANRKNSKKNDQREQLSATWHQYYGFLIPPEECNCDSCTCKKLDAKLLEADCPIKACQIEKEVAHCYECKQYPCSNWTGHKGLSFEDAKSEAGVKFDEHVYDEFLEAYDNFNRNLRLQNTKLS